MMTENEKAATFIGWREGQRTEHFCFVCAQQASREKPWTIPACPHQEIVPAPDMTDPRNYMKALEGLNSVGTPAPTISGGEGTWAIEWYLGHTVDSGDGRNSAHLIEIEEPTFAETVVKALAALYDAEHADNARMKG